ncbi:hypothetical protein RHCRD62_20656 [Rhodococcus sp. RD6.2]|nr:hypothetical protein RHCRD62_20656 [Rhodococcus sp. RD6.2]
MRRAHPHHLPARHRAPAAVLGGTGARTGLSGVRDPDGPHRRCHVARRATRRRVHHVRGHDARAGLPREPDRGEGARRRHSLRVLAAGRPEDRGRQPRQARGVLRRRLRDHRAVDRRHTRAGSATRVGQLHRVLQPRHDRPADQGDPRVPGPAALGVPRSGARVDGGGVAAVPLRARGVRKTDRGRRLRAAGHPGVGAHAAAADPQRPVRGGEPVQPRGPGGRQRAGVASDGADLHAPPAFRVARPGVHLTERVGHPPRLRGLRRRAAFLDARPAGGRPQGLPVRRGPQGGHQAVGVQGVRHRVHPGDPDRHLHGLARGGVRGLLQLRPTAPGYGRPGRPGRDGLTDAHIGKAVGSRRHRVGPRRGDGNGDRCAPPDRVGCAGIRGRPATVRPWHVHPRSRRRDDRVCTRPAACVRR